MLKIRLFKSINNSQSAKSSMITAAAAAGITLALGTPIGGVVFGMEVTSSIYLVNNFGKAMTCAIFCIIFAKIFNVKSKNMNLFVQTTENANIKILNLENVFTEDTIFYIVLAIICGFIGAFFCIFVSKLNYIRRTSKLRFLKNRFYYAAFCGILISSITFSIKPLMVFDRYMLSYIFNEKFPSEPKFLDELNHKNEGMLLLTLFCFKFFLTVISNTINMPTGVFAPLFVIGAFFGRFYGHLINIIFNTTNESIYAMLGAACVMSGATHSISSAIIIFELTGNSSYLLPMLLCCLISNLTAQSLSMNFFDTILIMKNLPHLPSIKSGLLYNLTAQDIMSKEVFPLPLKNFNFFNALNLLCIMPKGIGLTIPIVNEYGIISHTVQPRKLTKYLYCLFENYKLNYETDIQIKLQTIIYYLRRKYGSKHKNFCNYLSHKFQKIFDTKLIKEKRKCNKKLEYEQILNYLDFLSLCK